MTSTEHGRAWPGWMPVLLAAVAAGCSDGAATAPDGEGGTPEPEAQIDVVWSELPRPPGPFEVVEPLENVPISASGEWIFLGATGAVNVWDGEAWSAEPLPDVDGRPLKVTAIHARSPDDVHAFATATSGLQGAVWALHFDGSRWDLRKVDLPRHGMLPVVRDIDGSRDHLVAAGKMGSPHLVPVVLDLDPEGRWVFDERALDLHDIGASRGVLTPIPELTVGVGQGGLWLRDDDGFHQVERIGSRRAGGFEELWGASATSFFIVGRGTDGTGGIIITEWTGTNWAEEELKSNHESVRDMHGSATGNMWIVGKGGLVLGRHDRDWVQPAGPAAGLDYMGVWAAPTHDRILLLSGPVELDNERPVQVFEGLLR